MSSMNMRCSQFFPRVRSRVLRRSMTHSQQAGAHAGVRHPLQQGFARKEIIHSSRSREAAIPHLKVAYTLSCCHHTLSGI